MADLTLQYPTQRGISVPTTPVSLYSFGDVGVKTIRVNNLSGSTIRILAYPTNTVTDPASYTEMGAGGDGAIRYTAVVGDSASFTVVGEWEVWVCAATATATINAVATPIVPAQTLAQSNAAQMLGTPEAQELFQLLSDTSLGIIGFMVPGVGVWKENAKTSTASADGDAVAYMMNWANPTNSFFSSNGSGAASDANAAILKTGSNGINGMPALTFTGTKHLCVAVSDGITSSLDASQAFSIYYALKDGSDSSLRCVMGCGDGTGAGQFYIGRYQNVGLNRAVINTIASGGNRDARFYDATNLIYTEAAGIQSLHYTAAATSNMAANTMEWMRSNAVAMTDTAAGTLDMTSAAHPKLVIGNSIAASSTLVLADTLGAVIICNVCHTAAQRTKVNRALEAYYRINNPAFIAVADSNWAGYGLATAAVTGNGSPYSLVTAQFPTSTSNYLFSWSARSWAIAGELASTYGTIGAVTSGVTTTNYFPRRIAHYGCKATRDMGVCLIALGQNDIVTGALTGTAAWAQILSIIQQATPFFQRVVVQTLLPRGTAGQKLSISECNDLIRNNATAYGYVVSDAAARPEMTDNTNATYYQSDNIHVTLNGARVLADTFLTTLKQSYGVAVP